MQPGVDCTHKLVLVNIWTRFLNLLALNKTGEVEVGMTGHASISVRSCEYAVVFGCEIYVGNNKIVDVSFVPRIPVKYLNIIS